MVAVMISIHPKWCDLIASGKKTIEVRKTRPKLDTPFKCYIYKTMTGYVSRSKENDILVPVTYGKVIGEFVCDAVFKWPCGYDSRYGANCLIAMTCLDYGELYAYGQGKTLYGWHISELKIYDKPKELSAFYRTCPGLNDVGMCWACDKAVGEEHDCGVNGEVHLSRPPQSWCYVEELA